ncbi:MAG: integrase core domain-containing protein [Armatimonadetes bacterium]|nr:integrase core domain-containing protein [Armatimonadota bacterium]
MVLSALTTSIRSFLALCLLPFRSRLSLQVAILALRHQLTVYQRTSTKPRLKPTDGLVGVGLSQVWSGWREALVFVQPATVIRWQRRRFREHWTRLSRRGKSGRPATAPEIIQLIRRMSQANLGWGAPRILGELEKLGIVVAKSTVRKYMLRRRRPPSPTWRAFLSNHAKDLVAIDFFVVPTIGFKVLFVLVVLRHHRRQVVHFNVTEHPTAQWTAQQIVEAFPWADVPRYLLRDRDGVYGKHFRNRVRAMGIEEVMTAPQSPWQNPYAERLIGSIRRECLDHIVVFNEDHLRHVLRSHFTYYHRWRTHLSLDMDCPEPRETQGAEAGEVIEVPEVGGLHHHYERRAA